MGKSTPAKLDLEDLKPLIVKATGRGSRQMCKTDAHGFPKSHRTHNKTFLGFQTGDIVKANIPKGRFAGRHLGRLSAVRQRPSFTLNGFDVHPKHLKRIHRADAYAYNAKSIDNELRLVDEYIPGLLDELPQVETPSGGLHVFYRCKQIAGNTKLAQREVEASEGTKGAREREGRWFKVETTIETRGEGGYVITAGSPAACHLSGKPYRLINGDLKAIPEITEREREILLDCARSFNEYIKQAPAPKREQSEYPSTSLRPGDDFNQRGAVRALLEKHNWKYLRKGLCGELWRRPGGDHTSATLFPDGSLYVFSSNAHPFDHDRRYDRFSIYCLLEHDGDWKAAAKALADQGYGADKPKTIPASAKEAGNTG